MTTQWVQYVAWMEPGKEERTPKTLALKNAEQIKNPGPGGIRGWPVARRPGFQLAEDSVHTDWLTVAWHRDE